ncbi:unnamed protein product [Brachionus calyciflorus]|uniref:Uncharacterized protein n=1 Tax=Brachionus calyciflorus TaxID=104777 RepID=A0A813ZYG7_9BILA|nr:unnamed protein product [Brachionus calyciflorus]
MNKTDKYSEYNGNKTCADDTDHNEDKSPEEAYAANMKLIKKQKARFKRLEKILSRNVILIPLCAVFSVLSAVSLFVSTMSDHYEDISYNIASIKIQIEIENNRTLTNIASTLNKEVTYEDLNMLKKSLEEKNLELIDSNHQYVKPVVEIKTQNLINLILNKIQAINILELKFYQDYYIFTQRNYLDLNNSLNILLYESYSGIWKHCNYLSTMSKEFLDKPSCSIYRISAGDLDTKKVKIFTDLADPGRDLIRMHNAAACCTIVCYFLLIFSWVTALSAGFSKRVPLTFATCVLNMLIAVFLGLLLAIFHRKILGIDQKPACGESTQIHRIICKNRIVKFGYSLGLTWLAFLFNLITSICWLYITKMQKLLLAHDNIIEVYLSDLVDQQRQVDTRTPERVCRSHLESFTVKPYLTRAWYDTDQIEYSWADKRNQEVIANSDPEDTRDQGKIVFNLDEVYSSLEESLIDNPNNQHKNTPLKKSVECQTENYKTRIQNNIHIQTISNLFAILFDLIPGFNSKHMRIISVAIYTLLRILNIKFETCRLILESLNLLSIRTCHSWVLTIIDEDNPCVILRDGRGCYKPITFYENYPELEIEAKAFALNEESKKTYCVDQNGIYIGLLDICKKLGLIDNSSSSKDFFLKELREMLLTHPAFDGVNTHLEKLAA